MVPYLREIVWVRFCPLSSFLKADGSRCYSQVLWDKWDSAEGSSVTDETVLVVPALLATGVTSPAVRMLLTLWPAHPAAVYLKRSAGCLFSSWFSSPAQDMLACCFVIRYATRLIPCCQVLYCRSFSQITTLSLFICIYVQYVNRKYAARAHFIPIQVAFAHPLITWYAALALLSAR